MNETQKRSILQMARGAILERTDYEMSRLLANILDANTSPTAKRKLTITLELKPDDQQANETIRPIVSLRPYRTFQEVDQPESVFLIRINERGISFIEADGGMWKLRARETVKAFLEERLAEEVSAGSVIVAL